MIQNILLYNRKTETGLEPVYYQYDDGKKDVGITYGTKKYFCIEFLGYKYDFDNFDEDLKLYDGLFSSRVYRSTIRVPWDKLNPDLKLPVISSSVFNDLDCNMRGIIYEGLVSLNNVYPLTFVEREVMPGVFARVLAGVGRCIIKNEGRAGDLWKYETRIRYYIRSVTRTPLKVV